MLLAFLFEVGCAAMAANLCWIPSSLRPFNLPNLEVRVEKVRSEWEVNAGVPDRKPPFVEQFGHLELPPLLTSDELLGPLEAVVAVLLVGHPRDEFWELGSLLPEIPD